MYVSVARELSESFGEFNVFSLFCTSLFLFLPYAQEFRQPLSEATWPKPFLSTGLKSSTHCFDRFLPLKDEMDPVVAAATAAGYENADDLKQEPVSPQFRSYHRHHV